MPIRAPAPWPCSSWPVSDNGACLPPWEGPAILLVDLDAFFASVEQLDHPAWRGKPSSSAATRTPTESSPPAPTRPAPSGCAAPWASSLARELCPDAIWTHGNFHRYRKVSAAIMAILRDETPHVQQVSIDEAFMDVTPTAVNTEHPVLVAQRIQERVAALGVTCSIGVGTSKSVAKIGLGPRQAPRAHRGLSRHRGGVSGEAPRAHALRRGRRRREDASCPRRAHLGRYGPGRRCPAAKDLREERRDDAR